jgi:hypothetical protein
MRNPEKNKIKNMIDTLFFRPKKMICCIARKNQNMEISKSNDLPSDVDNNSVA